MQADQSTASVGSRKGKLADGQRRVVQKARGADAKEPLTPDDIERLRYATGRKEVDLGRSLFEPDSILWRVNRESVLLLGGGRALLLQVAHPLVAAGVAAYSNFRANPLERLQRTLDLTLTTTFASAADAIRAIRVIERMHARVKGELPVDAGPFPRGTSYDASDPKLLFWVHATLVDTALLVFERFFQKLTLAERKQYYEESRVSARLFGIPENLIPATIDQFDEYVETMFRSDELAITNEAREIAATILDPPLPLGLKQAARATNLFTIGLLPPVIRDRYGLSWNVAWATLLAGFGVIGRTVLPYLPTSLRYWPHARQALS